MRCPWPNWTLAELWRLLLTESTHWASWNAAEGQRLTEWPSLATICGRLATPSTASTTSKATNKFAAFTATLPNFQETQVLVGENFFLVFRNWVNGVFDRKGNCRRCGRCQIIASLLPRSRKRDVQHSWHHNPVCYRTIDCWRGNEHHFRHLHNSKIRNLFFLFQWDKRFASKLFICRSLL